VKGRKDEKPDRQNGLPPEFLRLRAVWGRFPAVDRRFLLEKLAGAILFLVKYLVREIHWRNL